MASTWADRLRRAFAARDEGELESAISDLPDNAELHLHLAPTAGPNAPNGGGDQPSGVPPAPMAPVPTDNTMGGLMDGFRDSLRHHDGELEEVWQAIENAERAVVAGMAGGGGEDGAARFASDARAPQRDARRGRMRGGDQPPNGGKKDDKDDDKDDKDTEDEFRDPPAAGNTGGKTVIPAWEIEAPPGTADRYRRVRDSAWMQDGFQQTVAIAEILVPGLALPTFDAAAPKERTSDALCRFRGRTLDLAWNQAGTRDLLEELGFPGSTRGMNCQRVRDFFNHAGLLKRRENNSRPPAGLFNGGSDGEMFRPVGPVQSPADLNEVNRKFYAKT